MAGILSCGDSEFEYDSSPCYLVFDNSVHQDPTLASALTLYSGTFATITTSQKSGARYFVFENNQGNRSESIFNAVDERRSLVLGKNGGLIVGYGNSVDAILYAYDRECPNCFVPDAIPMRSKPLTIGQDGMATCAVCKRRYDMNNGGNCVYAENDGDAKGAKGMTRYRGSTTGPFGRLAVSNN